MQNPTKKSSQLVIKVGTNVLTGGTDKLDSDVMVDVVAQVVRLHLGGTRIVLVTSGAIAAGRQALGTVPGRKNSVGNMQVLAAVGQSRLMSFWDELFAARGITSAQALLTRGDLDDRLGYLNTRNTLLALLDLDVVPIVNENDVVSVEEIEASVIGDNDNLSAQVANLIDADLLLLLTDTAGLYTADPTSSDDARLIETVDVIDEDIEGAAAGTAGRRGTGGMRTKVEAARIATQSGTHVIIADGRRPGTVLRACFNDNPGTHFLPTGDRRESRRRYLLSGLPVRGVIVVDRGAEQALRGDGTSLLPVGVAEVSGEFERGDVVRIESSDGTHIASGQSNYNAEDVARLKGVRSDHIVDVLGHEHGEEIVHRNNLVLV